MERGIKPSGEMLDVVNMNGDAVGEPLDKAVIHKNGLWHRDVHVWVTNGTQLLEQKRTFDTSIMPGQWDISVGGHVGAGESYLTAGQRETSEELGLNRDAEQFIPAGKLAVEMAMGGGTWMHRVVGDNFVLVEPRLTEATMNDMLQLQADEVLDARLYDIDELETDLANPETAKRHAEQPLALWALGIEAMRSAMQ